MLVIKRCLLHASVCWMMSCLWGPTRLLSPAWGKLGHQCFMITCTPTKRIQRNRILWCLNVSWTCNVCVWVCVCGDTGGLWWSGTGRWNKTLPWRDAAGAAVFNMKCSRSVQLFLPETQCIPHRHFSTASFDPSTSVYSPALWIAAVLPPCISQINTYTNVHPMILLHTSLMIAEAPIFYQGPPAEP